jgi:heptosyltransferase-2
LLESGPIRPRGRPSTRDQPIGAVASPHKGLTAPFVARTVLIVKLAAIGDVVMALPMVTALRAAARDVRITWMVGTTAAPLVEASEGIDEVVVVDETAMLIGTAAEKIRAVLDAWRKIAGRRFDTVYVAHSDRRYQRLAWPVRAADRRWLGNSTHGRPLVAARSLGDEYVRLVTGLDDYRAQRHPPPAFRARLPDELSQRVDAFKADRPLVALAPGGARNVARENPLRRWPLDRYADLARALFDRGYGVVVVGDESDGWVREGFAGLRVLDLVGATPLPALVPLFARCAIVVAHDSGPLHIARLAGARVVALFGPTPPQAFFRPDARTEVLWPGVALPCAPCYDGREFAACKNNLCMQMIETGDVLARIGALV